MKAIQLIAHGQPGTLQLAEVPDPVPNPDEVIVEVEACGLNHLDLWLEKGELPLQIKLPRIPGGELAGVIRGLGDEVSGWHLGDRVAVQSNLFCGRCEFCLAKEESRCLKGQLLGVQRDGGFAQKASVPARVLIPLPDAVSSRTSAALTLAGSTAMHMLTHRAQVAPGDSVLVIGGASGVGSAAIQIARAHQALVISTGSTQAKRDLATRLGAHHVLDPNHPDWPAQVRDITNKRGVNLVIEHVGGSVLQKAFECLARGGAIVTCGATESRNVPLNLWPFFVKEHQLIGSYGRNRADLERTLQWAADGRLKPVIDAVYSLERTPLAFDRLRSRQALGKLIVDMTID